MAGILRCLIYLATSKPLSQYVYYLCPSRFVNPQPLMSPNHLLLYSLRQSLEQAGIPVEFSQKYAALELPGGLEIASGPVEGEFHPSMLPFWILTIHPEYFPRGIDMQVVGLGDTVEQQVYTVTDQYLSGIFNTIYSGLEGRFNPEEDISVEMEEGDQRFHTSAGALQYQGNWDGLQRPESLLSLLMPEVTNRMENREFSWVKAYVARHPDGRIVGDCFWNNEFWPEGFAQLEHFIQNLPPNDVFIGLKQFILFRKCAGND